MEVPVLTAEDGASEYGSDFTADEEEILNGLLSVQSVPETTDNPILDDELQIRNVNSQESVLFLRTPAKATSKTLHLQSLNDTHFSSKVESDYSRTERESSASIEAPLEPVPEVPDLRSPLERFRTKPRKALSVTDLISPSWCELQYWFVLTKHGRKRRTAAMRQGSKVHKTLEEQVHVTVPVDIRTKEDNWGLRLWNIIQGLRTLREIGMTRELEIWGLLDGQVVNGVIDELTYESPDRELEAAAEKTSKDVSKKPTMIAPDQTRIIEFLNPRNTLESAEGNFATTLYSSQSKFDAQEPNPRVYISDIKTRGVRLLPKGASFKPTVIQLHLYHRLLVELAEGKVNSDLLFERYDLDKKLPFTDSFIAQIGNLNQSDSHEPEYISSSSPEDQFVSSQDSMTTLMTHNNLDALWKFMTQEFKTTFPLGARSIGRVLKAEYRDATSGDVMGSKTILYDHDTLIKYLSDEMEWWRGKRSARGVPVEEAFKCASCEFADGCEWRINKIDDHVKEMRSRSKV